MLKDCKESVTEHGDNNHYERKAVYMHDRACKAKIAKQAQFWVESSTGSPSIWGSYKIL